MTKILGYLVLPVIYGGMIVLGFLSGHPVIGIAIAVFSFVSLLGAWIFGQLKGAEAALRNPPPAGETQVTIKISDMEIPISDRFIFNPLPSTESPNNFSVEIVSKAKGGRPIGSLNSGENINSEDVMQWHKEAKRIWQEEGYKQFVAYCDKAGKDPGTVRWRIQKYVKK